jgi:hypothetical protein
MNSRSLYKYSNLYNDIPTLSKLPIKVHIINIELGKLHIMEINCPKYKIDRSI